MTDGTAGGGTAGGEAYRIVLHGFGSFPPIFHHLVEAARERGLPIEWSIILPTPHFLGPMRALLPAEAVLDVHAELDLSSPAAPPGEVFAGYPANIHADIEAEKLHLKHRPGAFQLRYASALYTLYKRFLRERRATHVLFASLEGFEGKMLTRATLELGATPIVPTGLRNLGGLFFGHDPLESLPRYAGAASAEARHEARRVIAAFRENPAPAAIVMRDPEADGPRLDDLSRPLLARVCGAARRHIRRPDLFDRAEIRPAVLNNLPLLRDGWRAVRQRLNSRFQTVTTLDALPRKFIYFPLQMTPETSINAPAPYFVDQLRAIDALRFAMPNDTTLVVKEHWASVMVRPASLMRAILRRSGVAIVRYDVPSIEIIRRAALTATVTGTAAFEALLLGRPSLTLGPAFFARFLGGPAGIDRLPERIAATLGRPPAESFVEASVATLLDIRCDAVFRTPGWPGEPVLRPGNIARFLDGLIGHIRRDEAFSRQASGQREMHG